MQAQAAQEVWADQPDKARDALVQIEAAGGEALGSMRRLVGTLRGGEDGPLAPAATIDDLRSLAARSTAVGLPVHLHLDGLDEVPAEVAPSIHRVVGEAITNAQRHATGATARGRPPHRPRRRAHGRGRRRRHRHAEPSSRWPRLRPHRHGRADRGAGRPLRGRSGRRRRLAHRGAAAAEAGRRDRAAPRRDRGRPGDGALGLPPHPRGQRHRGRRRGDQRTSRRWSSAQRLRPDVCLLDIRMPELDGLAATRLLAGPGCRRPDPGGRRHHVRPRRVRAHRDRATGPAASS